MEPLYQALFWKKDDKCQKSAKIIKAVFWKPVRALRTSWKNATYPVAGCTGFLLLDKNNNPNVCSHLVDHMQWTMKKYRRFCDTSYANNYSSCVTPHLLHQYGECGYVFKNPAIPNRVFWCWDYNEHIHIPATHKRSSLCRRFYSLSHKKQDEILTYFVGRDT